MSKLSQPLTTEHFSNRACFLSSKPFPSLTTLSLSSQSPHFYVTHFLFFFAGFAPTVPLLWSLVNYAVHDCSKLSPFFQFSELKSDPGLGSTELKSEG